MIGITLFLIFVIYLVCFYSRVRSLPPGPFPLPILGNFPQIFYSGLIKGNSIIQTLQSFKRTYGPVFTLWLGPMPSVNIADYQIAQEAMVKNGGNYADREVPLVATLIRNGMGIITSNGDFWLQHRRFALHTLRNFGLGRNLMEDRIMQEYRNHCEELDADLAKSGGAISMDPHKVFDAIVANTINRMLFSRRFENDQKEEFLRLKRKVDQLIETMKPTDVMITERTKTLPILKQRTETLTAPMQEIADFLQRQIDERKREIASGQHVLDGEGNDFVDAFLINMEKEEAAGQGTTFSEKTLLIDLFDLWLAGQETTSTTLTWAFNYFLLEPQVMEKLRHEIVSITGRNRDLSLNDKSNTPYLNAVILEALRLSSLLPFNIWRVAKEDADVGGHHIPKGTAITAQLSMIMNDEQIFDYKYNPERFLNASGERLDQRVIPFGIGKRACLGESLARAELYLIIGNLIQNYEFSRDMAKPPHYDAHTEMSSMRRPPHYNVIVQRLRA